MNHHWSLDRTDLEKSQGLAHIKEEGITIIWNLYYETGKLVVEKHEDCIKTLESDIKTLIS